MKYKILITCALATMLVSCGMQEDQFFDVPAGHIGKVLTPNGWQKGISEAGQVNLGGQDVDGKRNSLVFLESTAVQVKEQFKDESGVDNRIISSGRTATDGTRVGQIPLTADVYLRLRVPADLRLRNRVFAEITPQKSENDERVSTITVQRIYNRYAMQEARAIIREVLGSYEDDLDVNLKRGEIQKKLTGDILKRLEDLGVPLQLQSVSLSNVAPDREIQQNRNKSVGAAAQAQTIQQVGKALASNPGYARIREIEAMEMVATEAAKQGKPATFIIGISGDGHPYAARSIAN